MADATAEDTSKKRRRRERRRETPEQRDARLARVAAEQAAQIAAYDAHWKPILAERRERILADKGLTADVRDMLLDETPTEADEAAALFGWNDAQRVYQLNGRSRDENLAGPKKGPEPDQIVRFNNLGLPVFAHQRGRLIEWALGAERLHFSFAKFQLLHRTPTRHGAPQGPRKRKVTQQAA